MENIAILLSGSGVYDGSEIQEAICSMLTIKQAGGNYQCIAPDMEQFHVINHLNGNEMKETRNVLVESARIARGNIISLNDFDINSVDALLLPGGFGAAKNLSQWAINGAEGTINPKVKKLIQDCFNQRKPIVALCISPVVVAKALKDLEVFPELTVGTKHEATPYNMDEINEGLKTLNAIPNEKGIEEICVDEKNRIISAPCYMQDVSIDKIYDNTQKAIKQLFLWLDKK